MPDEGIIAIQAHDEVVLAVVLKSALDEKAAKQLELEVSAAAAARPGLPVVLDLAKVRFVPSVALGALVTLRKGLHFEGRALALLNVARQVRQVLSVARLDQLVAVYDTLDEALAHLRRKT